MSDLDTHLADLAAKAEAAYRPDEQDSPTYDDLCRAGLYPVDAAFYAANSPAVTLAFVEVARAARAMHQAVHSRLILRTAHDSHAWKAADDAYDATITALDAALEDTP